MRLRQKSWQGRGVLNRNSLKLRSFLLQNQESNSKHCISYAPGHNTHWLQAKVNRSEERLDAEVELLTVNSLLVRYQNQTERFYHHDLERINQATKETVLDYTKFTPSANLLYIQTEAAGKQHQGAFAVFYLANEELTDCDFTELAEFDRIDLDQEIDWEQEIEDAKKLPSDS
jgi:hypothetical protein